MTDNPFTTMNLWLEEERALGSINPNRIVLATAFNGIPHSRIVAIREITSEGVLFFTQQATKKVTELAHNPNASMTLWLAQQQRQVVLEGVVQSLNEQENQNYWDKLPREQQLRFYSYAPTSGQPIPSTAILDEQLKLLSKKFENNSVPMSPCYRGFHLIAKTVSFYITGFDQFSEVHKYEHSQGNWRKQLLCP